MAERRILDEISGGSYIVVVKGLPGERTMTLSAKPLGGGDSFDGILSTGLAKELRYSGRVAELGPGLTLQYGIFRTRCDYCAGFLLCLGASSTVAQLFLAPATMDWLLADPEEEHRQLQEARPSHRYGSHVANMVSIGS